MLTSNNDDVINLSAFGPSGSAHQAGSKHGAAKHKKSHTKTTDDQELSLFETIKANKILLECQEFQVDDDFSPQGGLKFYLSPVNIQLLLQECTNGLVVSLESIQASEIEQQERRRKHTSASAALTKSPQAEEIKNDDKVQMDLIPKE